RRDARALRSAERPGGPRLLARGETHMNLNNYTEKAQEAVVTSQQLAERSGHPEVTPEHLLLALLQQTDGIVPSVLGKMGVDLGPAASAADAARRARPRAHGGAQPGPSPRFRAGALAAEDRARQLSDEYTSTEPLLLALAAETGRAP